MKAKLLLLLLGFLFISITAHADNRNKTVHRLPSATAKITPCAPGVVYVKMKSGSAIKGIRDTKGNVTLSIGPSSSFASVENTLVVSLTVPINPAPVKDSIDRAFGFDRMYCLYYSNTNIDPHAALALLMTTGEVECGSVRYLFPVSKTTNDPYVLNGDEYALTNMNVFNAWNITTGDTTIIIADVDNAIDIDHEDLKNQIKYNWGEIGTDAHGNPKQSNGIDDDSDGYIDNWEGWDLVGDVDASAGATFQPNNNPRPREAAWNHGTLTAGCIAAQGNNGLGVAGVAYGCKLLPIKVAGSDGLINAGYEGIYYAYTHGARIINCSWGGVESVSDTAYDNTFLNAAHALGVLVVASAGNGLTDSGPGVSNDQYLFYPADGPHVLSVGATDDNDDAADFSDFGHSVSMWAPGVGIWSTDYLPGNNSYYYFEDGTSFSSPYTAGAAGLLWSLHPQWSPDFIAKQLIATCDDVVKPSDQTDYWGRINVGNALSTLPVGPGLIITGYMLDGVASDSLGPNHTYDFKVTFQNVLGAGTNITAVPLAELGSTLSTTVVSLGSLAESATATGDFRIARTGVYSTGNFPVRFAVTDGNAYFDTLTLYLPLTVQPGFVLDQAGEYGTSIFRVSNTAAWAAFGFATTNASNDPVVLSAQYGLETANTWSVPMTLGDGFNPPYCVTALDSNTAFLGSGPPGGTASVIHTSDGGKTFDTVSVASFAAFVNTIHFFDANNGILIGDPLSGGVKWGIGTTSDGGKSWHPLSKPVSESNTASWNNATAWVGDNGWFGTNSKKILHTTNRGQSWVAVTLASNSDVNSLSIAFDYNASHGLACFQPVASSIGTGVNGASAMAYTTDSGAVWQQLTTLPVTGMTPGSVCFIPHSDTAILTSDMGIYSTTDFGVTWTPIGIPVSFLPQGSDISISRGQGEFVVSINSPNNGVATYHQAKPDDSVADTIQQVNGVADGTSNRLSVDIYPNPAEYSATVSFTLPVSGHTRIVVYDALGREITTLVDNEFGAGTHQVTLDGHGMKSGIYYIDFESNGGQHITRTLTLLP